MLIKLLNGRFLMVFIGNSWDILLKEEWVKPYYKNLRNILIKDYQTKEVFPDKYEIFNALKYVDYNSVKVVIIGQDPYHQKGQAHGLSFSVPDNVKVPPSLINILKETETDLNITQPKNFGNLTKWATQGVLLLNATLTVIKSQPNSHANIGWQILTDRIITLLDARISPIVFLLWGAFAIKKQQLIHNKQHLILKAPHPSPLSAFRGFFGCKHFSKTNEFLKKQNMRPINWKL